MKFQSFDIAVAVVPQRIRGCFLLMINLLNIFSPCRANCRGEIEGAPRLLVAYKRVVERTGVIVAGFINPTGRAIKEVEEERNDDGQIGDQKANSVLTLTRTQGGLSWGVPEATIGRRTWMVAAHSSVRPPTRRRAWM